jgi:hypothetical protein
MSHVSDVSLDAKCSQLSFESEEDFFALTWVAVQGQIDPLKAIITRADLLIREGVDVAVSLVRSSLFNYRP